MKPDAPPIIYRVIASLGAEVGDYGRGDGMLVRDRRHAYEIKLEGWGPECVPGEGDVAAYREAARLAATWAHEMDRAGWLLVDASDDVWAITWGLRTLPIQALRDADPDEVLDLR